VKHPGKIILVMALLVTASAFMIHSGCTNGHRSGADVLVVTTRTLPDGTVGVAYEAMLTATRKYGPYDFSWSLDDGSGPLPNGLALSTAGIITGTPVKAGTYSFVVKVEDSGVNPPQKAVKGLQITVTGEGAIQITSDPTPLPTATVGLSFSASLAATGGTAPYNWALDSGSPMLPPGISLSEGGHFTGTPTQSGSYSFVVRVIDSTAPEVLVGTAPVTINVSTAGPGQVVITTTSIPDGLAGDTFNHMLSATGGTSPYTWSIASGALPTGLTLGQSTGQISGDIDDLASGLWTFYVKVTDSEPGSPSEFVKDFTMKVDPASPLQIDQNDEDLLVGQVNVPYVDAFTASGGTEPYTFSIEAGTLPQGLTLAESGDLYGVPEEPGAFPLVLKVTDSTDPDILMSVEGFTLTVDPPGTITIQQESLPDAVQNNAYEAVLTAVGGATTYTWSIASGLLPPGISLAADGLISGTCTTYGVWNFVAGVTDGSLSNTRSLSIEVLPELVIVTEYLPDAVLGKAYSHSLLATGGTAPYQWTKDSGSASLPALLTLSSGGHITGIPSAAGQSSFAVRVQDNSSPVLYATKAFTLDTKYIVITTTTLPDGTWGSSYSQILSVEHAIAAPLIWTFRQDGGELPPGFTDPGSLAPYGGIDLGYGELSGTLSGFESGTQTFTFTVVVEEESTHFKDEQTYTLTVNDPP
jgi:hypothetical protein